MFLLRHPRSASRRAKFALIQLVILFPLASMLAAQVPSQELQTLKQQAKALADGGDWPQAVATLEKAVSVAPNDPELRSALGFASSKIGRFDEAIANDQEWLRLQPRNVSAEVALAQAYRSVRNYEEAKQILEHAHHEHPKNPEPLAALGDLEIQLQTYDAAIEHLRAALALDPAKNEMRNLLAAAYKSKGDLVNALAQINIVLVRDPRNALAHFLRAQIYADRNENDRALSDARRAAELQPQNPQPLLLIAKILIRPPQGAPASEIVARCQKAVEAIDPILEARSKDSETLFLLSRAYQCAGQTEQSQKTLAAFEAASQNDKANTQHQDEAKHLVDQANDRAIENDFRGALDLLQQALAIDPDFAAAYSQLAKLYYSAGDIEKASDAISKALALEPYQPDFNYVQGRIFEKQGRLDAALSSFERTTLLNPKESDAFFEMGAIYQQRNDRAHALAAYKKALELSPDDPDYRRALKSLASDSP